MIFNIVLRVLQLNISFQHFYRCCSLWHKIDATIGFSFKLLLLLWIIMNDWWFRFFFCILFYWFLFHVFFIYLDFFVCLFVCCRWLKFFYLNWWFSFLFFSLLILNWCFITIWRFIFRWTNCSRHWCWCINFYGYTTIFFIILFSHCW